jgi:putative membrane protein
MTTETEVPVATPGSQDPVPVPHLASVADELAARRTGMSFQRTRMSADRTLMSVIRTSLSLISFGFTIYQFFGKLVQAKVLPAGGSGVRDFGVALVVLGIAMLISGIAYHLTFMHGLREQRARLVAAGLVHGESHFPASMTLIVAVLLLLTGLFAIANMLFHFSFSP